MGQEVVVYNFNPNTWEAVAAGSLSLRPDRATRRKPVKKKKKGRKEEE